MHVKDMRTATLIVLLFSPLALGQSDGNPHEWDRQRRCDLFDYDPPCGLCEGYGGIPTGDRNDQIQLSTCTPVATADEIDPETLIPPQWGSTWTLPEAHEILIGPKNDPFCFVVFPGADSIGDLCYVKQYGSKYYDMEKTKSIKEVLTVETPLGNVDATITHSGPNMWIVNHFPWWSFGLEQCVCVDIKEGGDDSNPNPIFPIAPQWVDNLIYIGREIIGVEYLKEKDEDLTDVELDHWAYGPHHVWVYPENGQILRMWQPFNGLQVYPGGVNGGPVDEAEFDFLPPTKCRKEGGATFRTKCDDNGYPTKDKKEAEKTVIAKEDHHRAETKVPRHDYKGMDFTDMSRVLNYWINSSYSAIPCDMWKVEELQQLQALLYIAKESQFDDIYHQTSDNRRIRHQILEDVHNTWNGLNKLASDDKDPMLSKIRRDGHCHEAVMWFVHHLTEDMKLLLKDTNIKLPLLSHYRHDCGSSSDSIAKEKVCDAYQQQVTCADCHSDF